jgi:hypothetical protein
LEIELVHFLDYYSIIYCIDSSILALFVLLTSFAFAGIPVILSVLKEERDDVEMV